MIPKTIHLCWFSGDEFPNNVQRCIDSWKEHLPDFEIKVWNAEMALATDIPFVREAIKVKKWAFAADVIRLYALYTEGGVYMDTDIFIRKRFDEFMNNDVVLFQEYHNFIVNSQSEISLDKEGNRKPEVSVVPGIGIQAAFMMSVKGAPFIKHLFDYYKDRHFIIDSLKYDMEVIAPSIFALRAEKFGYKYIDEKQELGTVTIYPSCFVAGLVEEVTSDSFAIHECANSWKKDTFIKILKRKIFYVINKTKSIKNRN